jgi:hypothetical protein
MRGFLDKESTMVATTFWETFFLFLIFLPLLMVWTFALVDIFRRDDMRGVQKALWVAVVILLPFVGTIVYLIVRPVGATPEERQLLEAAGQAYADTATQLQALSDLHDRGKLTDDEFAAEKARLLGTASTVPTA